ERAEINAIALSTGLLRQKGVTVADAILRAVVSSMSFMDGVVLALCADGHGLTKAQTETLLIMARRSRQISIRGLRQLRGLGYEAVFDVTPRDYAPCDEAARVLALEVTGSDLYGDWIDSVRHRDV